MSRLPSNRPPIPASSAPLTPAAPRPTLGPRPSGLDRDTLARHGGLKAGEAAAKRSPRPQTQAPDRTEAGLRSPRGRRPLSLRTRPLQAPKTSPGRDTRAVGAEIGEPKSLHQAREIWWQAAVGLAAASGTLRPKQSADALLTGEANVVRDHLRTIGHPELDERWLVTEFDARVDATAKRRRWALGDRGTFACVLEWLPFAERPAQSRPKDPAARLEDEVVHEVQTARMLNADLEVHALLRTSDGRFLAVMTDFPEDADYLAGKFDAAQRRALGLRMFAEVSDRLHRDFHRKGLIHGDVKLANLMMTAAGRWTFVDFGSSRRLAEDGASPAGERLKTTYPPPEWTLRGGRFGKAGDVWALGRTMVELSAYGKHCNQLAKLADRPALQQRAAAEFQALQAELDDALQSGAFERARQRIAGAPDKVAQLRVLQAQQPYLSLLQPLAEELPEVFAAVVTSLLAAPIALRRDAEGARALGQQLLQRNAAAIADNRAVEQRILGASAALELVQPTLRAIAEEEGFLTG